MPGRIHKKAILRWFLILIIPVVAGIPQTRSQTAPGVFIDTAAPEGNATDPTGRVKRQRWVTINFDRIRDTLSQAGGSVDARTLVLNLFPDVGMVAVLDRVETTSTGYVWVGRMQGAATSHVMLSVVANVMAGSITTPEATYAVRYFAGVHVIQELNLQAFPPELPPIDIPNPGAAPDGGRPGLDADDGSIIDVLVVYTPAARAGQGGTAAMDALIDLGITETNQAYADSGALQRIRSVHKEEVAYTESGSMNTDLTRLRLPSDGWLDGVHATRNIYGADLVQLLLDDDEACGLAYLMSTVSASFEDRAFGVVYYPCVSPNYSFAHEMGHNMGLNHDIYVSSGTMPYPYSHGYVNQAALLPGAPADKRWRDIMAYNDQCADAEFYCARLRYFSNPANTYTGDPMGDVSTADNVQALNNTRVTVANFRLSVSIKKRGGQLVSQ